jgi:hypothetical protein
VCSTVTHGKYIEIKKFTLPLNIAAKNLFERVQGGTHISILCCALHRRRMA